eukprot:scaffold142983_cov151-Phaeocystis_antarctica.AAC.1
MATLSKMENMRAGGPSRETESDRYGLVWTGNRSFAVDKGCMRIDERVASRTNKQVQPFTPVPDADVDLPNFDQWLSERDEPGHSYPHTK